MRENAKQHPILVALIGAVGAIIAGYLGYLGLTGSFSGSKFDYTGVVRSSARSPIADARVSITEDQGVPQHLLTDSTGVFHAVLHKKTHNVVLDVDTDGYLPYYISVQPSRTGPEEILLKSSKSMDTGAVTKQPGEVQQRLQGTGQSVQNMRAETNKQNTSDQWERSGDQAAKAAITEEVRISKPDYTPMYTVTESPGTPYHRIGQGWAEARHDWNIAIRQSAGARRVSRLKEKIGPKVHLTCYDQQMENVYCFPNGTDSDVLINSGQRESTTIRR